VVDIVLHVNTARRLATSPTMRIARFVSDTLNLNLVHDQPSAKAALEYEIGTLFVKYGMLKFSDQREEALELYKRAKRIINLENDYTFLPDSRFRKIRGIDGFWSTCLDAVKTSLDHYMNWNVLTWQEPDAWAAPQAFKEPTEPGMLYYGAYRPGRVESFERYFSEPLVPVTISSFRGKDHFLALNPGLNTMPAFRAPERISNWAASLYIEDKHSHDHFTSPANRFYECLQAGVFMLFDEPCVPNLEKAGIDPFPWVVKDRFDVADKFPHWRAGREEQRKRWWKPYHEDLRKQVRRAYVELPL